MLGWLDSLFILTNEIIPVPDPDAALKESDRLRLAGRDEDLAHAAKLA